MVMMLRYDPNLNVKMYEDGAVIGTILTIL
jgi:hypothetical protein